MKSFSEIAANISAAINSVWERRDIGYVPEPEDIKLGANASAGFEGCVLYADIKRSTDLVNEYKDSFTASVYKSFLVAVCDVIMNNQGQITSFDGDRVMAIFSGNSKCTSAVKCALQTRFVVNKINDALVVKYPATKYRVDYAVGVDVSELLAIRTGIRKYNDIAWIGSAANIAAKLSEIRGRRGNAFITSRVYERMADIAKFGGKDNKNMWGNTGLVISGQPIYGSDWLWRF